MFMLSFRQDEDVDKIYSIKDIMGIIVDIQPIRKTRLVPQCKSCQAYGHTRRYCSKEPRCVRCTGKHLTAECDKPKDAPPKCVHCGEGHPANYRGCIIAKEFQKIKNKQLKKPNLPPQPQRENRQNCSNAKNTQKLAHEPNQNKTYSQIVAGNTGKRSQAQQPAQQKTNIDDVLQKILDKLDKMDERISKLEYRTQGAAPKVRNG